MEKFFLITSSEKRHKDNYKYLGYGYVNIFENIHNKNLIFNHPWDNQKQYSKQSIKIKEIYENCLNILCNILNKHHQEKKNLRFWRIFIGPWLHTFIISYYEKYLLIQKLKKYKKKIIIPVTKQNIKKQIPENFYKFYDYNLRSDYWSNYLFSYILSSEQLNKNHIKIKRFVKEKKIKDKEKNTFSILFTIFKNLFLELIKFILIFWIRKQSLVFFDTHFSLKNKIYLSLKNFSFPLNMNLENKKVKVNINLRKSFIQNLKIKNIFLRKLLSSLLLHMPTDFLENYSFIVRKLYSSNIPNKPKVILTGNGIWSSSFKTRYIAENVSKGAKLFIAQHGGRYENLKNNFYMEHEYKISDFFISWGKNKSKKIKNFGFTKAYKKNVLKKNNKIKNSILFLMVSKGRYPRADDSEYNNLKNLFDYYSKICPNFYKYLNINLKSKLIYRTSNYNFWGENEVLKKKCKLSFVDTERHKTNFIDVAHDSRIVICSYLSTTFFELIVANIPVVLFTPFSSKVYNKKTLLAFNKMKKNNIFFDNEKKAANFLNKNWDTIEDWWWSQSVQKSRQFIIKNFSKLNPNFIQDVQKLLNRYTY